MPCREGKKINCIPYKKKDFVSAIRAKSFFCQLGGMRMDTSTSTNTPKKKFTRIFGLLVLSFGIPFIIIVISLIGLHIAPFGDKTLVISDANGYYINTLSYAGRMFKGLEGLTYSFEKGLGGNMTGHLNGILLTPFGFLFSLSDIANYPIAFTFISVLNFSLCGLTMYLLLANLYGHKTGNLIFSTSYALIGFNVANVFQAFFFCAAAPLPLLLLGLRKLFQGKSPLLYILIIAYGLFNNIYFGFVLCVASVLFFFVGLWLHKDEVRKGRLFLRYALSSLCGGLLACVLWLPGFLSLQGGRLEQTNIADFSFWENMPFIQIFSKLYTGANTTSELVNGLPNIFVGILPLALTVLFFIGREIDKRRKIAMGFLLGFFLISFWIVAFNMLMHGGTTTNWFNYRYSYIFSFLLLLIAAEYWQRIDNVSFDSIKRCAIIMVCATILTFYQRYEFVKGGAVLLDFALLALIFLAWRTRKRRPEANPKLLFDIITLIVVCINLFMNYWFCTKNIMDWGITLSDYRETINHVEPLVQGIQGADSSFYRMEINRQRSKSTGNDPILYGYDGVGHGGSYERNFVRMGANKLGVPWYDMRSYYADGIPAATDALLGIKYVIAEEDLAEEKGYEEAIKAIDWNIYVNPNAMPIAILSEGDIGVIETDFVDVFDNLNRVWASLSGETDNVLIEENDIYFVAHNMTDTGEINAEAARELVEKKDDSLLAESASESDNSVSQSSSIQEDAPNGRALKEPPENQSYIEYTWTAQRDGSYYSYNRSGLTDTHGSYDPVLRYEGTYKKGETVTGYLPVPNTFVGEYLLNDVAGRFRAASADEEALARACQAIASQPVVLEKIKNDHLSGQYVSDRNRQLLFTIPWDEGWTLYVDGEKTDLRKSLDVFMVADVPEGTHSIEMRYVPAGLQIGKMISMVAAILTLLYLIVGKRFIGWSKICKEVIQ